jgi:hypothetical protein
LIDVARQGDNQTIIMALGFARLLAALALAAGAIGAVRAASVMAANSGFPFDARLLWCAVPLLSATLLVFAAGRRSLWSVWTPIGACSGFVVLTAWSLGLFFGPSTLLMLASGVAHGAAVRPGREAALAPLWFFFGATGFCAVLLVFHQVVRLIYRGQFSEPGIITVGTAVFVGLLMLLGVRGWIRAFRTNRHVV